MATHTHANWCHDFYKLFFLHWLAGRTRLSITLVAQCSRTSSSEKPVKFKETQDDESSYYLDEDHTSPPQAQIAQLQLR
jgi:hypothetical protein